MECSEMFLTIFIQSQSEQVKDIFNNGKYLKDQLKSVTNLEDGILGFDTVQVLRITEMLRRNMLPPSLSLKERHLGRSCSDDQNGVVGNVGVLRGMWTHTSTGINYRDLGPGQKETRNGQAELSVHRFTHSLTHILITSVDINEHSSCYVFTQQ